MNCCYPDCGAHLKDGNLRTNKCALPSVKSRPVKKQGGFFVIRRKTIVGLLNMQLRLSPFSVFAYVASDCETVLFWGLLGYNFPRLTMPDQQPNHKFWHLLKKAGLDGFVLALAGMILIAYWYPAGGSKGSLIPLGAIGSFGVSFIFFFYGLRLSKTKLKAGLSNWKLHVLVHSTTFIVFPAIVLPWKPLMDATNLGLLWLGAFFLASLPSTVSSSVVMVSIARGNLPAAIFNASISSLLGVFFTPIWMGFFLSAQQEDFALGPVFQKLALQILLPVVLGILLNPRFGALAEKHKQTLRYFDQTIILMIVYTSFCESFEEGIFGGYGFWDITLLSIAMGFLFWVLTKVVRFTCHLLKFNREDTITAIFCGSKKSLVHGTVMSKVLFANSPVAGILLLPLMVYHALQLVAASMMAQAMAAENTTMQPSGKQP